MRGTDYDEAEFEALVAAEFGAHTGADELDAELLDSLWIEDAFGEVALDPLVEDYCRSVLSIEEISAYRALAGVEPAPLLYLPIPAEQVVLPLPQTTRRAA